MKKLLFCLLLLLMPSSLTGCQKQDELTAYQDSMTVFCDQVVSINDRINIINPVAPDAKDQLLTLLDELDGQFRILAEIEVPSKFISNVDLADQAADYMSQAVALYHQGYDSDTIDENTFLAADEYYARANKRLHYILEIMAGNIPEEAEIITLDQ